MDPVSTFLVNLASSGVFLLVSWRGIVGRDSNQKGLLEGLSLYKLTKLPALARVRCLGNKLFEFCLTFKFFDFWKNSTFWVQKQAMFMLLTTKQRKKKFLRKERTASDQTQ